VRGKVSHSLITTLRRHRFGFAYGAFGSHRKSGSDKAPCGMAHRGEKARPSSSDDVMEQDGTTCGTSSFFIGEKGRIERSDAVRRYSMRKSIPLMVLAALLVAPPVAFAQSQQGQDQS